MNGHAPDCMCLGCQLQRAAMLVDEPTFRARVATLTRGGLPSSSIPNGSRSAEKPMPKLDRNDVWILAREREWSDAARDALKALRALECAQRAVLGVMGVEFPHEDDPKYAEKLVKAMNAARSKATEVLVDEEQGTHRFQCIICTEILKRTKECRPKAQRCPTCYAYWAASGFTKDRSAELVGKDIDRKKAVG